MDFKESDEFLKEFKKLKKKYRSLPEDLRRLKRIIEIYPEGGESKHSPVLKEEDEKFIVKRRMVCKATQGTDFRIIYFYNGRRVEILFIEIYFKGQKENEDKNRVENFWKDLK